MKYLILLVAMLATVAEAKEPVSSCLRLKDVSTEKLRQGNKTLVGLTLERSCPVEMQSPDGLPLFEFQNPDGLRTTVTGMVAPIGNLRDSEGGNIKGCCFGEPKTARPHALQKHGLRKLFR